MLDQVILPLKKVCFETWGCQMNVADSEKMLSLMSSQNYERTDDPVDADLIVLNTCHIREKAYHKVMSRLGMLKDIKKKNKDLTIAVTGCVAQAEGKRLLEDSEAIDVLIGPGRLGELANLVAKHKHNKERSLAVGFEKTRPTYDAQAIVDEEAACHETQTLSGKTEISRYVNIQQGCNNFCTFCVVPFTRGREVSEYPETVLARVKGMLRRGAKEITLLGQNVNSYGHDFELPSISSDHDTSHPARNRGIPPQQLPAEAQFSNLLKQVASLQSEGLKRLRFTTSNPHDFTKDLAIAFRDYPVLGRYIHLPVQSGSNRILEAMKRKVTVEEYLERIHWLREAIPDISISTDLIVGFPGETDEDFEGTLDLVQKVGFSFSFCFMYSPRKGTAASRFQDKIPEAVKQQRLARLNELQNKITERIHAEEIGQVRQVLFHYRSKKNPQYMFGRTEHFRLVRVETDLELLGEERSVLILSGNKTALTGSLFSKN